MTRVDEYLDALVGSEDYVCPNCQGVGRLFTGCICTTCGGTGRVTGAEMDAYDEQVMDGREADEEEAACAYAWDVQ